MKAFTCDNCKKVFGQPLDEVVYIDDHSVTHIFDLCAPCRATLKNDESKPKQTFFSKVIKEKRK